MRNADREADQAGDQAQGCVRAIQLAGECGQCESANGHLCEDKKGYEGRMSLGRFDLRMVRPPQVRVKRLC